MVKADTYDVFIAYPGEDAEFAARLREALVSLRLTVFLDTKELTAGDLFMRDIPAALARTHVVAVLVTPATPGGWFDKSEVARAIKQARDQSTLVVPVCVDGAEPFYGLEQLVPIRCGRHEHDTVAIELFKAVRKREGAVRVETPKIGPPRDGVLVTSSNPGRALSDTNFWALAEESQAPPYRTAWSRAAKTTSLWPVEGNLSLLRQICEEVAELAQMHAPATTEDPWFDPEYPVRVLARLADLRDQLGFLELSAAEVAALVSAVFYKEAAYNAALAWLEKGAGAAFHAATEDVVANSEATRLVTAARRSSPLLSRRWTQFSKAPEQHQYELRALGPWLTRKAASRFAGQWLPPDDGTLPEFPVTTLRAQTHRPQVVAAMSLFTAERMTRLARCVRCDPERVFPAAGGNPLDVALLLGPDLPPLRERLLGALLCMAGWLALDIRSTDDTLAEHLGTPGSFPPSDVCRFLNTCAWTRIGGTLELAGGCPHPLADRTVEVLVEQAYAALSTCAALIDRYGVGLPEAIRLPIRLSADGVVPSRREGDVPYVRPHLRFQLSTGEIRELLMGEKLYGDPDVSIREMYQNALDACRYAKARIEYVRRTSATTAWSGHITFRQGVDSKTERRFVECEDTGIGMGVRELSACFAQAGRRFADLPEFLEEQELWRKLNPPIELVPNSQFGIGVLSYFMIADEIEVTSCRMTKRGEAGPSFSVRIPGTGSLFQLQDLGYGKRTGTKVRLYLREDWGGDCEQVLLKWLVAAEFETVAVNEIESKTRTWSTGIPMWAEEEYDYSRKKGVWVVKPCQFVSSHDPDFWWISKRNGLILSDGLRVDAQLHLPLDDSPSLKPWFSIINLTGRYRPALTVDRRKLVLPFPADEYERILINHAEAAAVLEKLSFNWLWGLAGESQDAANRVFEHLCTKQARLPITDDSEFDVQIPHTPASPILHYHVNTIGLHHKDDPIALKWIAEASRPSVLRSSFGRLHLLRGIELRPRDPLAFMKTFMKHAERATGGAISENDFDRQLGWRRLERHNYQDETAQFDDRWIEPSVFYGTAEELREHRERIIREERERREEFIRDETARIWGSFSRWLMWGTGTESPNAETDRATILSGGPIIVPDALCDPDALYQESAYEQWREYSSGYRLWQNIQPLNPAPNGEVECWASIVLAELQTECETSAMQRPDTWTIAGHRASVWIAAGHPAPEWVSAYLPPMALAESQRAIKVISPAESLKPEEPLKPDEAPKHLPLIARSSKWWREKELTLWTAVTVILGFALIGLIVSVRAVWHRLLG